jgi:putative ABC transport system substrate-binding protein
MAINIARRVFTAGLGGAALAWPLTARAQQRVRRVAMLMGIAENDPEGQQWAHAFLQSFQDLGWRRGVNVLIDLRWAGSNIADMRTFAKELVGLQPDLIHVTTTRATAAILQETRTIPVVFSVVSDPVGAGFVQNLPRPGGNATGFINIEASLGGKWLSLLKEIAPHVSQVAIMFNPKTAPQTDYYRGPLEAAAQSLGIVTSAAPVHDDTEIETVITALGRESNAGFVVTPDVFTAEHRDLIAAMANRNRVPAVYSFAIFARAGGLVSYGIDLIDLERRAAVYADRILKGATPAELPVQLPTKFELVINLTTAKALGLTIPHNLLVLADEVIE